jgi:hypothetical protein
MVIPSRVGVNAAHDVKPMKAGIFQLATWIGTSVRGLETLKTFSSLLSVPLSPVAASMAAVSSGAVLSARAMEHGARAKQHAPRIRDIFSVVELLSLLGCSIFWSIDEDLRAIQPSTSDGHKKAIQFRYEEGGARALGRFYFGDAPWRPLAFIEHVNRAAAATHIDAPAAPIKVRVVRVCTGRNTRAHDAVSRIKQD